ncbi:MAG: TRAP transporter TatT component family protein [Proteobacteria bacterium]|nr:TRAP transporter TatT component family protein [Pseudomonadota bacterium]
MAQNLSTAMLNHNDLETVKDAAPAYLLLTDSMVANDPDDAETNRVAASLYGAYTGVFVENPARSKRLSQRAFEYALHAACLDYPQQACEIRTMNFQDFEQFLQQRGKDDVPTLYTLGASWAGWIQVNSEDWNAVAELPRVTAIMQRVVELDETYQHGTAHIYLGVIYTLLPPAAGGKPELARNHFERAIAISNGRNLTAKLMYANRYAKMMFNAELFNSLLQEVINADPTAPDLTLLNMLAQKQARQALAHADDYF